MVAKVSTHLAVTVAELSTALAGATLATISAFLKGREGLDGLGGRDGRDALDGRAS